MLSYVVICTVALLVAALTLFSGFGLGTLLMPAFAIFFPVPVAIAATAIVHLGNNLFKLVLVGRWANFIVVVKFALPAAAGAIVGALVLNAFAEIPPLAQYTLAGRLFTITAVKLVVAVLMIFFAILELAPGLERLQFGPRYIPLGGILSGFFGGLSGHQGALRSAFLIRAGLTKEAFIGTSVVCAVVVDIARLLVYGATVFGEHFALLKSQDGIGLVAAGTLAALVGSLIGSRLVKKVTLRTIQLLVGVMLLIVAIALGLGLV